MIVVVCTECSKYVRVMGDQVEIDPLIGRDSSFWPRDFKCPWCNKTAQGLLEREAQPLALTTMYGVDLTPQEAFIAFNGMGLPGERECTQEQIEELFKSPIRRIVGQETMTKRFILEHIEFWDGTKIYLGSAPGGAVVYKISSPPEYAKKVLDE